MRTCPFSPSPFPVFFHLHLSIPLFQKEKMYLSCWQGRSDHYGNHFHVSVSLACSILVPLLDNCWLQERCQSTNVFLPAAHSHTCAHTHTHTHIHLQLVGKKLVDCLTKINILVSVLTKSSGPLITHIHTQCNNGGRVDMHTRFDLELNLKCLWFIFPCLCA